jgi:hypothetical protein
MNCLDCYDRLRRNGIFSHLESENKHIQHISGLIAVRRDDFYRRICRGGHWDSCRLIRGLMELDSFCTVLVEARRLIPGG